MAMRNWGRVSEIDPHDDSSWRSRFFLTVDADWAPDFVIEDCLRFLAQFGIPTTWFVTHNSIALGDVNPEEVELGLHPNFSPLITNPDGKTNGEDILRTAKLMVPFATSFRNHSLVQSSPLLDLFQKFGFTHECNLLLPHTAVSAIQPWFHWNGIVRVPHCWEDDVWVIGGCRDLSEIVRPGLAGITVLDIHPIHIYLNTSNWDTYKSSIEFVNNQSRMDEVRLKSFGHGVRTVVEQMLEGNV